MKQPFHLRVGFPVVASAFIVHTKCQHPRMNVCSNLGYVQNKPLKEKIPRKKRKNQEGDEPDGLENHEVEDITQQQELEQPQPYQPGILDEIDFEPQDGDSSGAAGSFSFSEEQPERLRDGSSADGSMRAPSVSQRRNNCRAPLTR